MGDLETLSCGGKTSTPQGTLVSAFHYLLFLLLNTCYSCIFFLNVSSQAGLSSSLEAINVISGKHTD